jgi:hypothetical protein
MHTMNELRKDVVVAFSAAAVCHLLLVLPPLFGHQCSCNTAFLSRRI